MSKGRLVCSLVLVQLCIVQLFLISSWPQLTAGQPAGGKFLCQDPIGTSPRLMSNHGREELDGPGSDSIFDEEELADEEGFASDGGGVAVEGDEGWLPDDDGGSGAKGSSSGSGSGGDVECPECGKFFKNDKSMFGHLRSHPNRGYKGATPPVNKLKLSPEMETTAASRSSLSPSRGTPHQPRPQRDRRLIALELLAPYALLTLQCRADSDDHATQQATPLPLPPPCFRANETNVGVSKQRSAGQIGSSSMLTEKAQAGQIGSSNMLTEKAQADECSSSILKIPKKKRNMLKQTRETQRKKPKIVLVPPPPPKEKGPYICKHCFAEFSTHQALGGHSAAHHRDLKVPTVNDASSRAHQGMPAQSQDGKLQVKGGGDDDSGVSLRRGLASNVPRQSGQSSGGQMIERRQQHSGRRSDGLAVAAPAPAPAQVPASTPTQADDRGGRRLLNIDLNAEATEHE